MRDTFVRVLADEMAQDPNIVLIIGDLGFGVMKPIWERFPDRIINAGIAEQSMVGLAAGLAATGKTVLVYSIGNFPVMRPLEQIRNDCAYHNANVKIVCVGGGFVYGSLGMSHHATEDLAVMRALPDVRVFAPGDPAETGIVTREIIHTPGTCYLRLGRGNEPMVHTGISVEWKAPSPFTLRKGKDIALLSTGGILTQTVQAAERLAGKNIWAEVVSFPCIKPMDTDAVKGLLKRFRHIVTVEEHNIIGGLGSAVCEIAAEAGTGSLVHRIGLQDCYSTIVGNQQYLREVYGMDEKTIADKAEAWLNEA